MKSTIKTLTDEMMQALGPVFHLYKDWEDIRLATCLVMARVIQATPHKGLEPSILTQSQEDIAHALEQFLKLEEAATKAQAAERERLRATVEGGIAGFGNLTVVNGSEPGPALVGEPAIMEEPIKDFYDEANEGPSPEDINDVQSAIEEVAQEEAEQARMDTFREDGHNPDGPRAYAP